MALNINGTTGISGVDGSASAPALQGTDSNTGINFASDTVNINTGGSTRYSVDSSGNIQAGGANPVFTGSSLASLSIKAPDGGSRYFFGEVGNSASAQLSLYDSSDSQKVRISAHSTDHTFFTSGSSVLVGTTNTSSGAGVGLKLVMGATNPTFNLVINQATGNHSFYHLYNTNASNNGYRFYVMANGGIANHSGNNTNLSDERMKKNITNMGSVYNTFKQFVFKDFNYISDSDSEIKKHGVIAQEVETIDSDLITEDFKISGDNDENYVYRKALKEEQFVMIGLKALQEAIAKIETLETKVAALEAG